MKTFRYQAGFVFLNGAIRISFNPKHLLLANWFRVGGWRDKKLRLVLHECINFLNHGFFF